MSMGQPVWVSWIELVLPQTAEEDMGIGDDLLERRQPVRESSDDMQSLHDGVLDLFHPLAILGKLELGTSWLQLLLTPSRTREPPAVSLHDCILLTVPPGPVQAPTPATCHMRDLWYVYFLIVRPSPGKTFRNVFAGRQGGGKGLISDETSRELIGGSEVTQTRAVPSPMMCLSPSCPLSELPPHLKKKTKPMYASHLPSNVPFVPPSSPQLKMT